MSDKKWCGSKSPCSEMVDKMDFIEIVIDSYAYWVPPMGYTMRQQNYTSEFQCLIAAQEGAEDGTIELGSYFLTSFYAEFDYSHMQISFGVNNKASWMPFIRNATELLPNTNWTVELKNVENELTGSFYLGTPQQKLKVVYSTLTPFTNVESDYNMDDSTTASPGYKGLTEFTSDFASVAPRYQAAIPYGFL